MDLPFGSDASKAFLTNVGLITSNGPWGPNVMSAEWTHHISYEPGLIAICPSKKSATYENIHASKEFGVSIASSDQNVLTSVAGNYTGKKVNKIELLKELGFRFYQATSIKAPMVEGTTLNVECKLIDERAMGDHMLLIGEALEVSAHPEKTSIILSKGKYWHFGEQISKPPQKELDRIDTIVEAHGKKV